jgi:serine/threonine-protein kinase RsbW
VHLVREHLRRDEGDRTLMLFETALAEVGANVLRYAHPEDSPEPLAEYELRLEAGTLTALLTDRGPPLHNQLSRGMPAQTDESGRGLAIARKVLDELDYEREGEVNTWRLVKRL